MEKILVMNPGSTSTKIAVYQDETPLFVESIEHSQDELKPFENIIDQYEMRKDLILATMEKNGVHKEDLTAIVSRGGLLPPIKAGAYRVNEDMVHTHRRMSMHPTLAQLSQMPSLQSLTFRPIFTMQ